MSDYKLTYFDGLGLAELIRLIFVQAEVSFKDVRIDDKDWDTIKPTVTYGVLPTLETEGQTFFQSIAIARYLARKFGLAGKTELEHLKVDIVIDTFEDAYKPISAYYRFEDGDKRKEELKNTYANETLPRFLGTLEKLLKSNKNGDEYFVGDSLTWADLHIIDFVPRVERLVKIKVPLENYPKLKNLYERVSNQPKIANWIALRTDSGF